MDREVDALLKTYLIPADEPGDIVKRKVLNQVNGEEKAKVNKTFKWKVPAVAGLLACFLALSAFAYNKFSDLAGDELALSAYYKGDGVFEIHITNLSDKMLKLQEEIKLMRWSTGEEIEGDKGKIVFENTKIDAHTEGTVIIDISQAYDVDALEEELPEGDWYYFILTNNHFAFGQDWMCSLNFDENAPQTIAYEVPENVKEEVVYSADLRMDEWTWPTNSKDISAPYGTQENGVFSEHINIAGEEGDEVYSVADGVVTGIGFENRCGNYVVIDLGGGISVKYGHLKEILVEEGETVVKGQEIAELGKTGMATGPNLLLAVYMDGEAVNPLKE